METSTLALEGTAGLRTQLPGEPATISAASAATGGIGAGNFIERDIDEELFRFQTEDTALMALMLKAKKVKVTSPEVEHYMIDEKRSTVTTASAVTASSATQFVLPLISNDQQIPREYSTLLVQGMDGYNEAGTAVTPGKPLMLFVCGRDDVTGNPVVRAVNGQKAGGGELCSTPAIAAGTKMKVLGNALYETQKEVDPNMIVPHPGVVYLQKRGMNQVVSDYFDAQKKRIPFTKAILAETAILDFKREGNRTLWAGRKAKFSVTIPKIGQQMIYCTEGVRWQFKREFQHRGAWTFAKLLLLAKMFFTGEDVPKTAILLAGKNLLEELQKIDWKEHPEVQVSPYTMPTVGWDVTRIHTVFGDIMIKREPTLDTLGWSNSGGLIGEDRLVHYTFSQEHEFDDAIEGQEARRKGILVWDALALKGGCHIWIDGEGETANSGSVVFTTWDSETAPTGTDLADKHVYLLLCDCPGINASAQNGQAWQAHVSGSTVTWTEYEGEISVD